MFFVTYYNNYPFFLYDYYFDNKEKKYVQIFGITNNAIIIRSDNQKKYFLKNYLKNLVN